jgi:hypothetical protein
MARTATRRSTRSSNQKKTSRNRRRALNPKRLPYADEAQTVTDVFHFLTSTLPEFIEEEFERLDIARSESELFRELANLPDATLRKAGLRREDLPRLVLSAFHLIKTTKRRRRVPQPGRARAAAR